MKRIPLLAIATLLACGDSPTSIPSGVPSDALHDEALAVSGTTITVSPPFAILTTIGQTAQFTATVRDNGEEVDTATVDWSTTDPAVATVSNSGLATAMGSGFAVILAEWQGALGAAAVVSTADDDDCGPVRVVCH